ncbi:MAG: hypothetical protein JNJ45_03535 [Chthonomonas sp.]|nr:hypothetical protein [Chthonomonas sp.]
MIPWDSERKKHKRDDYAAVYDPRPFHPPTPPQTDPAMLFNVEAAPSYRPGFQYGGASPGGFPPDNTIAVGPSDMVVSVNTNLRVYDLNGVQQVSANWSTLLGTGQFLSDPNFRYDTYRDRFIGVIISIDDTTNFNNARWWLLMSDDNTAEGTWTALALNARQNGSTDQNIWADYPHIGYTNDAIAVSAIMFPTPAGSGDSFGKVRFMDADDVFNGGGIGWKDFWNLSSNGSPDKRVFPATMQSSPSRFYVVSAKEGGASDLTVREYDDTAGGDNGAQTNLLGTYLVPVNAYITPPDIRQPSGAALLDNIDCRILQCEYIGGRIFAAWTSAVAESGGGNRSVVRVARMTVSAGSAPTVTADATFGATGFDYFYPGVVGTTDGDCVVVFGRSGTGASDFAELRWTSMQLADTALEGSALAKAGENTYSRIFSGRNRWGDYFTCALDPFDSRTVWMSGEYAESAVSGTTQYGAWIFSANYKSDHALVVSAANIQQSDTGTLTCTVTDSVSGAAVPSAVVNWTVNGVSQGTSITNASGIATKSYTVPSGTLPTSQTISCTVNRTTTRNEGTDTAVLTVSKANTAIQITNETGEPGETVTFTLQLIRTTDGAALASKTVSVTVNGVLIGSAVTNASGFATRTYTITNPVGAYAVHGNFAADSLYNAVSDTTGLLTVTKGVTNIAVPAVNGTIGSNAALTGTLTRTSDNTALSGRTLSFTVDGVGVGTAVTNASGLATFNWNVTAGVLGARTYSVSWLGDTQYNSDSTASTFNRYANTTLTVPNVSGQRTQSVALTATLRRAHDSALVGSQTVNFTVDGVGVGSAITNGSGVATLNYVIPAGATFGAHPIGVTFPAAGFYNNSSGSGTLTVGLPTFNGDLTLLQWGGSNAVNAVVTVRNTSNVVVQGPTTVATNAAGVWALPTSLAAGTYRVTVKTSHWLSQRKLNITLNTTTGTSTILHDLLNGDCDGNDIIDIADYSIVASAFDAQLDTDPGTAGNQSSPNWDIRADLNGDGIVDIADYSILAGNFDKFGDG